MTLKRLMMTLDALCCYWWLLLFLAYSCSCLWRSKRCTYSAWWNWKLLTESNTHRFQTVIDYSSVKLTCTKHGLFTQVDYVYWHHWEPWFRSRYSADGRYSACTTINHGHLSHIHPPYRWVRLRTPRLLETKTKGERHSRLRKQRLSRRWNVWGARTLWGFTCSLTPGCDIELSR